MGLEVFVYDWIEILAIILEIASIGLLSVLLYLYIKSYRQIKIGFTVGLVLFASVFLVKSIVSIVYILISSIPMDISYIVQCIIQLIGLGILLKITIDY